MLPVTAQRGACQTTSTMRGSRTPRSGKVEEDAELNVCGARTAFYEALGIWPEQWLYTMVGPGPARAAPDLNTRPRGGKCKCQRR